MDSTREQSSDINFAIEVAKKLISNMTQLEERVGKAADKLRSQDKLGHFFPNSKEAEDKLQRRKRINSKFTKVTDQLGTIRHIENQLNVKSII